MNFNIRNGQVDGKIWLQKSHCTKKIKANDAVKSRSINEASEIRTPVVLWMFHTEYCSALWIFNPVSAQTFHLCFISGQRLVNVTNASETSTLMVESVTRSSLQNSYSSSPRASSDASKVLGRGPGLSKAFVGQKASFTVDCSKAGKRMALLHLDYKNTWFRNPQPVFVFQGGICSWWVSMVLRPHVRRSWWSTRETCSITSVMC